jgi:hypothetical protein
MGRLFVLHWLVVQVLIVLKISSRKPDHGYECILLYEPFA